MLRSKQKIPFCDSERCSSQKWLTHHWPLLYGPYVIYRSLDGSWYRVIFDTSAAPVKELIKVPFKAGWTLVSEIQRKVKK